MRIVIFGKKYNKNGYIKKRGVIQKDYFEHRQIAKQYIKRNLRPWEEVHHINHNSQDNRPVNLCVMNKYSHRSYHRWANSMKKSKPKKFNNRIAYDKLKTKYPKTIFIKPM